jgi:hypothetical protein
METANSTPFYKSNALYFQECPRQSCGNRQPYCLKGDSIAEAAAKKTLAVLSSTTLKEVGNGVCVLHVQWKVGRRPVGSTLG